MTKPVSGAGEREGMDQGTDHTSLSSGVAERRLP
jgi:hypothetical protein